MAQPASTRLELPWGGFRLLRYPRRNREPLQAWCAADLLLLDAAGDLDNTAMLAVNDDHGALTVALQPAGLWTDSALAARATRENLCRNHRQPVPVHWSTESPPAGIAVAVLRIPKQLPYLQYQLALLARTMPPGSTLLAAGMDKHLSPHTAELIDKAFGATERHRGQRKARLFSARRGEQATVEPPPLASYHCDALGAPLKAMANVFSRDSLDIGSRFLLQYLDKLPTAELAIDLACGNGVLGLAALQRGLCQHLLLCDESAMAIASSRINAGALAAGAADRISYHHGDGLIDVAQRAGLILCNPPFHLGHTVDDYAGRRLLQQCAAQLLPGGFLCIVANRHLEYRPTLQRHFRKVEVLAENRKFTLWLAQRG